MTDRVYRHVTLASGDSGAPDPDPERRYLPSRVHDRDLSAHILAGDLGYQHEPVLMVDDLHAPAPFRTVQELHRHQRSVLRWYTREMPASAKLRGKVTTFGPYRTDIRRLQGMRGRFPWAKRALWEAVDRYLENSG